ncbi:heavy-metal-associated domain-containing protein [Pirellulaceae bacterium SH449]
MAITGHETKRTQPRFLAWAGLFALFIGLSGIVFVGCNPSDVPSDNATASSISAPADMATVSEVGVRIDTMMCVEGCFNSVKELLEKRTGIEEVRLAPQKEEGSIDNSMVYIKHRGELDRTEMERLILGAGFEKVEFVE